MHHPKNNFMSKWHLIQPSQREISKKPRFNLLYSRKEQKSLVTHHTLQSLYVCVWLVNTFNSTAPIGSPIICMWSPADIWEQWEKNLSFSTADVRGAGTRDDPLRTSPCEATFERIVILSECCGKCIGLETRYLLFWNKSITSVRGGSTVQRAHLFSSVLWVLKCCHFLLWLSFVN